MKTLLMAFAFLLVTFNANAEEIRAGWIAADLEKSCKEFPGATGAFCECAVNKLYDADFTDQQLEVFLGEFDENDPDRKKLIALLEGKNASVNAKCGG